MILRPYRGIIVNCAFIGCDAWIEQKPEPSGGIRAPLGQEQAKEARKKIHLSLTRLEGYAQDGGWVAGPEITAAGIVGYPALKFLLRAAWRREAAPLGLGLDDFERSFPGLSAWMQKIERRPGYENTYPPHWRQN